MITRFFAILACVLATLLIGAYGGILGPLFPAIAEEFHLARDFTGTLSMFSYAGSVASVLIGGYFADRFGKRRLFLITVAGLGVAFGVFFIAPWFAIFAAACLFGGAMGGTLEGLSGAVIADLDPAHTDRNFNLLQVAFCAGAVITLLVTARLQAGGWGWRLPFLVLLGGIVLVLVLGFVMRIPPAPPGEPISPAIAARVMRDRPIVLLSLAIALYVGSEMSLATWISPLLQDHLHYKPTVALLSAGAFWFSMGLARIVVGFLCHRFSGRLLLGWLILGGLLSYVLLLLPGPRWQLWTGIVMAGATFSGIWPLIVSLGSARYPQYSGTVVAILVASGTAGAMLFPTLTGIVIERGSPSSGLWLMAGLFAGLAAAFYAYTRRPVASEIKPASVKADR